MWFEMRREDLGFVERAHVVHVTEAGVSAPRAVVFDALAEPSGWKHWFPNVRAASYTSPPPHGVGTIREADVGGTRWVEEMIAWDPGTRWGWTVTRASVPFALGAPFAARTIPRLFHRAMRNLGAYLDQPQGEQR